MARQDANDAFALTSFLYGGNAAYIEELHARYEADPASVDAEWRDFFESLKDDPAERRQRARAARRGSGRTGRVSGNGELVAALDGNWAEAEKAIGDKIKGKAQSARRRIVGGRRAAGDARFDPRADDDPRLPHARPSPRQSRSARPRAGEERGRARSALLRLHRGRSRPPDLHRQRARPRIRDDARDPRHPAAHLLPDARRRVHAHLRSRSRRPGSRSASRARTRRSPSPARARGRSSTS